MRKLKIVFHIHTLTRGGAERAVINLSKAFAEHGNEVKIITSVKSDSEYSVPSNVERIILTDKSNELLNNNFERLILLGFSLRKFIKKEKPDVLISFISGSIIRGLIATLGTKTKLIASVRNDPAFEYRGKAGKYTVRFAFPLVDAFVFQTSDAQNFFKQKIREKSTIIFNSVNDSFFEVDRKPIKNTVISCGRLDRQKNQELLINAFVMVVEEVPDAKLLIYGKGPEQSRLAELIEKKRMNESITLCGETSDMSEVMSKSDVFVLSSDFEGMPNVLIEAITSGIPSISTDCPCGGPSEIIQNNENGVLVPVGDKNALANAIIEILKKNELKNKLSTNAKKSAHKFSSEAIYKKWDYFIKRVLEKK